MTSLVKAILNKDRHALAALLQAGPPLDEFDGYGYTPLIETAIVNDARLGQMLLEAGADPNFKDMVGGTALHWAVENSNLPFVKLLLEHKADPNAYNNASEPVVVKPLLRRQMELKRLLYRHGAQSQFAMDYINYKLLGHRYDLKGEIDIVDAQGNFTELGLEGFFLEFSLGLVSYSLHQYQKNYAAREARDVFPVISFIEDALRIAAQLIKYQQYMTKIQDHEREIHALLANPFLIIPANYAGHAITFIRSDDILVKCDRRKKDNMLGGITFYRMRRAGAFNIEFIKHLIYEKKDDDFINHFVPQHLGLELKARMMIEPQMSGNCSWANVVSCVPAIYFLMTDKLTNYPEGIIDGDHEALNVYRHWREWDKLSALQYCLSEFPKATKPRKASLVSLLAKILFQRFHYRDEDQLPLAKRILSVLHTPGYEYVLESYLEIYFRRRRTQSGENFKKLIDACSDYL